MSITLREYILSNSADISLLLAETTENWPCEEGDLLNWRSLRMATPEEKKAVEAEADLDLKATQQALQITGENPLTPREAKDFWMVERAYHIYADHLDQTLLNYQKHQEALKQAEDPETYSKQLIDAKTQEKLADWRSYNERNGTFVQDFASKFARFASRNK